MVTTPDFGPEGASSILAKIMSTFFNLFLSTFVCAYNSIMYVTQTPQTISSTRAVQGVCHIQLATTLYIHALHPPAEHQANITRVR